MARDIKPIHLAVAMTAINFVWRLLWLFQSQGCYTDGILQITAFEKGITYWPPLYTLLAHAFAWVPPLGLEGSARLISVLAGSLAVIPIEIIARRLFGARAGQMTAVLYTVSPIPLRWSLQVMTDSTFMFFWMSSLSSMVMAARAAWPELYEQTKKKSKGNADVATRWLLLASLCGVLATLTRYQGAFLVPVVLLVARSMTKIKEDQLEAKGKMNPYFSLAPWAIVLVWLGIAQASSGALTAQADQFSQRTGVDAVASAKNYLYVFEQFVLLSPYFLTYGIFGFFLYGLFRVNFATKRIALSVVVAGLLTLAVLGLQAFFQAFQSRYLLPVVPFTLILAGHGMATWERHCESKPARFWVLAVPALGYSLIFSALVAYYQGNPFIDIKRAGEWVKQNAGPNAKVYSTEVYNSQVGAAKLSFWSGHEVTRFSMQLLKPGDLIVLPSLYGAVGMPNGQPGMSEYMRIRKEIIPNYPARSVFKHAYSAYPLLPDLMADTRYHTNPLAWYLRYERQDFRTEVFKVIDFSEAPEDPAAAPAGEAPAESAAPAGEANP